MLRGYLRRHIGNSLLAGGKTVFVKITNVGFQHRFVLPGLDAVKPDITFAPLGAFRGLLAIEMADEIRCHQQRVDQHPFGGHRVRRDAGKANFSRRRVKVLVNNFAQLAAVDGPGKIDVEAL